MNRAQRRAAKKRGEIIDHSEKNSDPVDRSNEDYCWLHPLKLEDKNNPTERDKKLIESVRLRPVKSHGKDGSVRMGRQCPRCGNFVPVSSPLQSNAEESIILVPDKNDGNVQM